jgi:ABC-type nitrate/sulfonate/bicarbonate transport system permease component
MAIDEIIIATGTAPRPPRTAGRTGLRTGRLRWVGRFLAWSLASALLGAVLWQGLIWLGILPSQYFPDVVTLLATWAGLFVDVAFWTALWDTLMSAFLGLVLGVVAGVAIGVVIGRNVYAFHASRFVLEFLRPIPTVALIPAVVLALGTGLESKLLLVFLAVVFPIIIQTTYGIVDVDPVALDTAKTFHFSWGRRLFQVLLPAAGPFIMTGLRVAAAVSLLVAVSTEIIIGSPGLGQSITLAEQSDSLDRMYALIAMTGFLGIIVNSFVVGLEKKLASWARNPEAGA